MIVVQMYEILNSNKLFEELQEQKLPIRVAYKLNKISDVIAKEIKFYTDSLTKITTEYSVKDETGRPVIEDGGVRIIPESLEECQNKLEELNSLTLELDAPYLTLDELDTLEVSFSNMKILSKFITE